MLNKEKLKDSIQKVVLSGILEVQTFVKENEQVYISRQYEFPFITKKETGFDEISKSHVLGGPKDYSSMFLDPKIIDINLINGYQEYLELLGGDDYFKELFSYRGVKDEGAFLYGAQTLVTRLINAYLHIYGVDSKFKTEDFNELYKPIEEFIFAERLYFDIFIPILFTKFDFEKFVLSESEDIEIVKLTDNLQLSRSLIQQYGSPISNSVLNGASHALRIKGFSIEGKQSFFDINQQFSEIALYPIEKINAFFNSMRIVTLDNDLGYAQLLAVPVGWTEKYTSFLTSIYGTTVRSYPKVFEDYYWLRQEFTTIDESQTKLISNIFKGFDFKRFSKLQLVNKRLNMCVLREEEEDSMLDAIIAMEALLSDGGTGELTHKLAMRMAAIFKISTEYYYTPEIVFDIVKKIYTYRSSIVHGGSKPKHKEIVISELELSIPTSRMALILLKIALKVLIENPKYFDPKTLDFELLKGSEISANKSD